jgi:hypothetical protein
VSVLKDNGEYVVEKKNTSLTVLFCKAWARCCAPSSPIWFSQRLSVVSVCTNIQIDSSFFKCIGDVGLCYARISFWDLEDFLRQFQTVMKLVFCAREYIPSELGYYRSFLLNISWLSIIA